MRGLGRLYRRCVVGGRWVVLAAWVAVAAGLTVWSPAAGGGGGGFGDLLPADSPVVRTQVRAAERFRVPVVSGTTVVVHDPGGLSILTRADATLWALAHTQAYLEGEVPPGPGHIVAAVPVSVAAPESDDTFATYLYVSGGTGITRTTTLARQYAAHFSNQASVSAYVTGFTPAQVAQVDHLRSRLPLFEAASIVLIVVVVALVFGSVVAPLAVLAVAAVGYLVHGSVLSALAGALGFEVPSLLEPVLTALLLGVVTDYCVLFFSTFRDQLDTGVGRLEAARRAVRADGAVVAVAGLTVAGGTISLLAAPFGIFRSLGPALALTVVVGVLVSLGLAPAVMAVLGTRLFPGHRRRRAPQALVRTATTGRHRLLRLITSRPGAVLVTVGVVAVLVSAATPLGRARLDLSFTAGLPDDDRVSRGAEVLQEAGVRGITAPTVVVAEGEDISSRRPALERLQAELADRPGVARVLGPAQDPLPQDRGVVFSTDGDAARFLVVYDSDPLGAEAIRRVRALQEQVPQLARDAGLGQARTTVTGQTVLASEIARLTRRSLEVTLLTALAVELVVLALYLRALVAPVVLLAGSALSVAAALGLTTLLFQTVLHEPGLTFYAPFATAVLLLALGSDYTVFSVGTIWREAASRPMRDAVLRAVPRTARAISAAGFILASTFAIVAVIPLTTFRQIAFTMALGLLLDTLVVRPVLTPAVLVLLGNAARWPSRRPGPAVAPPPLVPPERGGGGAGG